MPPKSWPHSLSVALKKWCDDNDYANRTNLARDLKIKETSWHHIIRGDMIATDIEIYARIFVKTNLPEADPRTLPPIYRFGIEKPRAWSEAEFSRWLAAKAPTKSSKPVKRPSSSSPSMVGLTVGALLGGRVEEIVNALAAQLGDQVADVVVARLALETKLQADTQQQGDIGTFAKALLREFKRYMRGSSADRDALMKAHGRILQDLYSDLRKLTAPAAQREEAIDMQKGVDDL